METDPAAARGETHLDVALRPDRSPYAISLGGLYAALVSGQEEPAALDETAASR